MTASSSSADDFSDDPGTQGVLRVGGSASGVLGVAGDEDWFAITLDAGTSYDFSLAGAQSARFGAPGAMPQLQVWNPAPDTGGYAAVTELSLAGAPVIEFKPATSGSYFLAVAGASGTGAYTVTAQARAHDDHADGIAAASTLHLGTAQPGQLELPGDKDVFMAPVDAGKTYVLSVAGNGGALPVIDVSTLEDGYAQPVSWGGKAAATVSFTATATTDYIAAVRNVDPLHGVGGYVLAFAAAPDDFAANAAGAGQLALDTPLHGRIDVAGDVDWLKVHLPAGQPTAITLDNLGGAFQMTLVDQTGSQLAFPNIMGDGGDVILWSAPREADYFVQVQGIPGYAPASGDYSVSATPHPGDDFSADSKTAGALAVDKSVSAILGQPNDVDWFKVSLSAGKTIAVGLEAVPGLDSASGHRLSVALFNAQGNYVVPSVFTSMKGDQPALLKYLPQVSGDYFVAVQGDGAALADHYRLTEYGQPADALAADAGTVGVLAPGQAIKGTIDSATDRDWYKIDMAANQGLALSADVAAGAASLGSSGDVPTLTLVDATGKALATSSQNGAPPSLSYWAAAAGTYYVEVAASGLGTGAYVLAAGDGTHTLPDIHAPAITSVRGPGAAGAAAADVAIGFGEAILAGDGKLTLALASGAIVDSFDIKTDVSIAGSVLTVNPRADLLPATGYVLTIAAGAIKDAAGNANVLPMTASLHTADADLHLSGGSGNDVFHGSSGNDSIDGGAGIDTVVLAGDRYMWEITQGQTALLAHAWAGATGDRDLLTSVERLRFDDGALAFDIGGSAGQVYRLYEAAFARAPDEKGTGYWLAQADQGMSLNTIAANFVASSELTGLYGAGQSDMAFVSHIYTNVLHREADAAGLAYWTDAMAHGLSRADALVAFSESPENQTALFPQMQPGISYVPFL